MDDDEFFQELDEEVCECGYKYKDHLGNLTRSCPYSLGVYRYSKGLNEKAGRGQWQSARLID